MFALVTIPLCWLWSAFTATLSCLFSPVPLAVLIILLFFGYRRYTRDYNFWRSRGVPGPEPLFPWGSDLGIPFMTPMLTRDSILYNDYGGKRYCGLIQMGRPMLFAGDPDLIRAIFIKDFNCFTDRRSLPGEDTFDGMLLLMKGQQWKDTRTVMTPTFSASKLRGMHQLTVDNAEKLRDYIRGQSQHGEVDVWEASGRFAMDNIASCAFGVDCNSFNDPDCAFAKNAHELFSFGLMNIIRVVACYILPFDLGKFFPDPTLKSLRFLSHAVKKTIAQREQQDNNVKDFLQLLLETTNKNGERVLSDDSVVMQSVLFLSAGFDTTSRTLMFAMYCLARNAECQRRAQQEVDQVLAEHDGQLTHDAVAQMTYLERFLSETLRMFPLIVTIERESTAEWTIPGTEVTLPAGTVVNIPVYMVHHDEDYYPSPETFDPDRFLPENKEARRACTYLPFGAGPRNCIGMRFALFEMKVALALLLQEVWLQPGPHTPQLPLQLGPRQQVLTPPDGQLLLEVLPRRKSSE